MGAFITKIKRKLVEPSLNEREILELKMKALSKKLSFVQESFSQAENDLSKILSEGTSKMFQEEVLKQEQKIIKKVILLSQREQEELKRREAQQQQQAQEAIERAKAEQALERAQAEEGLQVPHPRGTNVYEEGSIFDLIKESTLEYFAKNYFRDCRPALNEFFKADADFFQAFIETKIAAFDLVDRGVRGATAEDVKLHLYKIGNTGELDDLMLGKYFDFISDQFKLYYEPQIQEHWVEHQLWVSIYIQENQRRSLDEVEIDSDLDNFGLGLVVSVSARISIFCILEYLKFRKIHNLFIKIKVLEFLKYLKKILKGESSNIPS